MKQRKTLFPSLTLLLLSLTLSQSINILFVGNSYTYAHGGLNTLVKTFLVESGMKDVVSERVAYGGYEWREHHDDLKEGGLLRDYMLGRLWDFVVLQEQSDVMTMEHSVVTEDSMNQAFSIAQIFYTDGGYNETTGYPTFLIFETWGKLDFFDEHQVNLVKNLNDVADYINLLDPLTSELATCSDGWQYVKDDNPTYFVSLYESDGSHPSVRGHYLNGLIFYARITGNDPRDLDYAMDGLTAYDKIYLQGIAYDVLECNSTKVNCTRPERTLPTFDTASEATNTELTPSGSDTQKTSTTSDNRETAPTEGNNNGEEFDTVLIVSLAGAIVVVSITIIIIAILINRSSSAPVVVH